MRLSTVISVISDMLKFTRLQHGFMKPSRIETSTKLTYHLSHLSQKIIFYIIDQFFLRLTSYSVSRFQVSMRMMLYNML